MSASDDPPLDNTEHSSTSPVGQKEAGVVGTCGGQTRRFTKADPSTAVPWSLDPAKVGMFGSRKRPREPKEREGRGSGVRE